MTRPRDLLQFRLLKQAIQEEGIDFNAIDTNTKINHQNGYVEFNNNRLGLKYPKSYVGKINALPKEKVYDFCFIGYFEDKGRQRLLEKYQSKNSYIKNSFNGRDPKLKYNFDISYYSIISSTKYGLVPNHKGPWYDHEYAWSYRFIECLFSKALPILFKETKLGKYFLKDYNFIWDHKFTTLDNNIYKNLVEQNYQRALNEFILQPEEINNLFDMQ
jgi:hypothetical protein